MVIRSGGDAYVDLPLVDGLAVLARYELNTSYPQERTDQRITRVLNDVLWTTGQGWLLEDPVYSQLEVTTYLGPVGDRALDTGVTTIQASTLSGENALSHLQAVEKSEGGLFFLSANGGMTLYNRRRRSTNAMRPMAIFGDRPDNGELLYVDAQVTDDTPQASSVAITQQGGSTVVVEDAATKADSFPATVSYTVLTASLAEIDDAAHWWLARIKSPEHRLSGIDLDGLGDPTALWPTLLGAEIGDMITVRRRPQAIGAVMERNCYIEQVQHSWSVSAAGIVWDTHWALSTADGRTYWILDLNSTLDVNAILGY